MVSVFLGEGIDNDSQCRLRKEQKGRILLNEKGGGRRQNSEQKAEATMDQRKIIQCKTQGNSIDNIFYKKAGS